MRWPAFAACLPLALAGCGGGPGQTPDAATLAPPGTSSYLRIRTGQFSRAVTLLPRFPTRGDVLRSLPIVPSGAGPELDVATVAGGRIYFTQPADRKAFERSLDEASDVHARLRGWTVFAASRSLLDAVRRRTGSLAQQPWYAAASGAAPGDAAVREVVPGWRAAALRLGRGSPELVVRRTRAQVLPQSSSGLAAVVPADAIVAAGAAAAVDIPAGTPGLLRRIAAAAGGPVVGWVRPGAGLPEVTVVAQPAQPAQALRATARLIARLTKNPAAALITMGGVRLREVVNGAVTLYYGLVRDRLVASDDLGAALRAAASSGGMHLGAASELPGAVESWLFVDVVAALPLAHTYSGLFGVQVPPDLAAGLTPLDDLLVYRAHTGRVATTVTRLHLRRRP